MKLVLSVVFCLLLAGDVFAKDAEAMPDDPLYQAKRQMETAQLNAALDPLERAKLHTKLAGGRLTEVKGMITKGKPEFVESLLNDYERSIGGAMDEINRAQSQGKGIREALEAVERSTKKHTEVLTDLLGKVPEQAKPAIRHSIEVSKLGRDVAIDRLRKIQRGEIPAGKPDGIGKPEKIEKPEMMEKPDRLGPPEGIGRPSGGMSPGGIGPSGRGR